MTELMICCCVVITLPQNHPWRRRSSWTIFCRARAVGLGCLLLRGTMLVACASPFQNRVVRAVNQSGDRETRVASSLRS